MVSYQAWVSIVFETLKDRGVQASDIEEGAAVMEFAAETWNAEHRRLDKATQAQARQLALYYAQRQ
jgi:hypothetical protein